MQYITMQDQSNKVFVYGYNDISDGEHELLYKAQPPLGLDDFFKHFVKEKNLRFSNDFYQKQLINNIDYSYKESLSPQRRMVFIVSTNIDDVNERDVIFQIYDTKSNKAVITMKAEIDKMISKKILDSSISIQKRDYFETKKVATDFLKSDDKVLMKYGELIDELCAYCLDRHPGLLKDPRLHAA
jgi:hypothetical protein